MPERARANRVIGRLFIAQVVAVVVLIVAVLALEANTKTSINSAQRAARVEQTDQLRQGCARGVQRDFEAYGVNQDLMVFANDAAAARRAAGQIAVAQRYAKTADHASARMVRIGERLPSGSDQASIAAYCRELYPVPR